MSDTSTSRMYVAFYRLNLEGRRNQDFKERGRALGVRVMCEVSLTALNCSPVAEFVVPSNPSRTCTNNGTSCFEINLHIQLLVLLRKSTYFNGDGDVDMKLRAAS